MNKVEARVQSLSNKYRTKYIQPEELKPPQTLYHYTNSCGLTGMLNSSKFWATSFKHMNDTSEFAHGLELAKEIIEDEARKLGSVEYMDQVKGFLEFLDREKTDPKIRPYLLCLSELRDDLSQWRGYGDFGKGFSIGFTQPASFSTEIKGTVRLLSPVVYRDYEKRDLIRTAVQEWYELLADVVAIAGSTLSTSIREQLNRDIFQILFVLALRCKHHAFEAEREWRYIILAQPTHPDAKIRPGRFGPTDYFEVQFGRKDIQEIILGPCFPSHDRGTVSASIRGIFDRAKLTTPSIINSSIPFI